MKKPTLTTNLPTSLVVDIRTLVQEARVSVAVAVNSGITMLYWLIGKRINEDVLKGERAEYGKQIVVSLSRQLVLEYGQGFSAQNLRHFMKFGEVFPDEQIVSTLWRQLRWSHFKEIIYLEQPFQRDFYAEICRLEKWNVRTLRKKIGSMLYERTAISKKPDELIRHELDQLRHEDQLSPDLVFRDPYLLDFLGLSDRYIEKDLEDAILREIENFLLELGVGFTFVARQKRIMLDNDDYYLDLLFFHRGLRRLVAIELKMRAFRPADKGQMELYLRWLEKYEMKVGEELPIGLILCAGKKQETVELMALEQSGIRVAEYLTELPSREALEARLHQAITTAHHRRELKK
ncbi:MAG: PDDEXK nuclease domain-containing protein [Deltaproteobacteria bacterium]